MGEVVLMTPVDPSRRDELQEYLRGLRTFPGERSPFTMEPCRTHFARFVVLDIDGPQLIFTSRFDGEERTYLQAIAEVPQALEIFERCTRPSPLTPQTLREYLLDDKDARVAVSYVLPWQEPDTVANINRAIALRAELAQLAVKAETLDAVDFAHELRQLPAARRLLAR
jgi:hypothetical protein